MNKIYRVICFTLFAIGATVSRGCAADALKLPDLANSTAIVAPAEAAPVIKATVNVPTTPVDWHLFLAELGALWSALAAVYQFIKLHHAELAKATAIEDFIAYCYQNSGNGPTWLNDAFDMVGAEFQKRFGKVMTQTQWTTFKHALAALHLEVGLPKSDEDPQIMALEKQLADLKKSKQPSIASVVSALLIMMLMLTGCSVSTGKSTAEAEAQARKRWEAHVAALTAAQQAEDAALANAQQNDFQFRLNQRNAAINNVVAQRPDLISEALAAKDTANAEFNLLQNQQMAAQAKLNSVIAQSAATNLTQARALSDSILKAGAAPPFDAASTVTTIVNGLQQLAPPQNAVPQTAPTAPIAPSTPAVKPIAPAVPKTAGSIVN